MRTEDGPTPIKDTSIGQSLAVILPMIAVVISVGGLANATDGDFWGWAIALLGSLLVASGALNHKNLPKSGKVDQRLEYLNELHSEGLINESDYEKKKQEILDEV